MNAKQQGQPKAHKPEPAHQTTAPEAVQLGPKLLPAGLAQAGSLPGLPDHGATRPLRQAALLQMQRQFGNSHVQRFLIQRDNGGTADADAEAPAPRPTFSFTSAGQEGDRFDSNYTPVGPAPQIGDLDINLWVHITFAPFTRAMMRRPDFRGHRWTREQIADFAWTDDERETFETGFMSSVQSAWSGQHMLHLDDPDFAEHRCRVNVNVMTISDPGSAHVKLTAQKVPQGAPRFRSFVQGDEATLDIRDPAEPTTHQEQRSGLVRQIGPFDLNSADLTSDLLSQIGAVEDGLRPLQSPTQTDSLLGEEWAVDFTGRASASGSRAHNERLGLERAQAVEERVKSDLGRPGVGSRARSVGRENAANDPRFQRVDVVAWHVPTAFAEPAPTHSQNVAAHEAGHMFGLGDEYIDERPPRDSLPKFMGDRPTHYGDVETLIGTDAADELLVQQSGSIMSQGGDVQRGHYVYFLQALNQITNKSWTVE